ncbi:MAG: class I SAM-dependent methyltransferase [Bacteroidia bacterium]
MNLFYASDFTDLWFELKKRGATKIYDNLRFTERARTAKHFNKIDTRCCDWWIIPQIKQRWNLLISGNQEKDFSDYLCENYFNRENNYSVLSIGSGGGNPEIKLARHNCFSSIEAFDISDEIVAHANKKLKHENLPNLKFFTADVYEFDFTKKQYDAIMFHSSLHHLKNHKSIFEKVKQGLKPGGLLLLTHEYVGANRFQISDEQLSFINKVYDEKLPKQYKLRYDGIHYKQSVSKPGLLRLYLADPSESSESENILPLIHQQFKTIEEKPLGGNLLHLLLKDIAHNFLNEDENISQLLEELFATEDNYLNTGKQSDFVFGIYGVS